MNDLSGKVVLVTGASRGIGSAIARELAEAGALIAINYSKDDVGAEKTLDIIKENGGYAKLFKKDIAKFQNCKELISEVVETFGKIDILINNAGVSKIGLFMDLAEEEIDNLLDINLKGAMYLSKFALQFMAGKGSGNIINISSIWGEAGASCEVLYSTSKGGMNLFTKALAKEVAPFGIRVNGVAPGVIDTEMNNFLSAEEREELIQEIPAGRFGDPKEIAKVVRFLASDKCGFLTGQIIKVDGAMI